MVTAVGVELVEKANLWMMWTGEYFTLIFLDMAVPRFQALMLVLLPLFKYQGII